MNDYQNEDRRRKIRQNRNKAVLGTILDVIEDSDISNLEIEDDDNSVSDEESSIVKTNISAVQPYLI